METTGRGVPTGCYKCGRPGHWSRDCPSGPAQDPNSGNPHPASASASTFRGPFAASGGNLEEKSASKPKKLPKSRPKLTPQLLVSDDGLGYVLRHFPRNFKYRGRGHEVSDLSNLIGMYRQWHSHLLPYYSFDQFVHKVEKVAATNQVKRCVRELKDRVAHGGDPTKLHEPPTEDDIANNDQAMDMDQWNEHEKDSPSKNRTDDNIQDNLFNEIFEKAMEDQLPSFQNDKVTPAADPTPVSVEKAPNQSTGIDSSLSTQNHLSEDQKARMEANRVKALERAAARARTSKPT
ncbi:hypothetical protein SAY86_009960 [Trapa natans]|uniref:CCHC-type domain-containing protein n=1 Tax=Trapa natans TaxID=22666 RepID=A0AAN7QTE9_TRANT|nr:hypothetical protein SAY86_009960 [Trapa natans]